MKSMTDRGADAPDAAERGATMPSRARAAGSTYASQNSRSRGHGMCPGPAKCVALYGMGRSTPGTMYPT